MDAMMVIELHRTKQHQGAEMPRLYKFRQHNSMFQMCYNSYGISVIHKGNGKETIQRPTPESYQTNFSHRQRTNMITRHMIRNKGKFQRI